MSKENDKLSELPSEAITKEPEAGAEIKPKVEIVKVPEPELEPEPEPIIINNVTEALVIPTITEVDDEFSFLGL